jgi:hypothetical protein
MTKVISLAEDMASRMARGGHGIPKVSPAPAMPNTSVPLGRATPETARRARGLRLSSTLLYTPRRTPMITN